MQVNVSAAVEIVSNLGLWEKFEGGKIVSMAEILELTKADEIIISMPPATHTTLFPPYPEFSTKNYNQQFASSVN